MKSLIAPALVLCLTLPAAAQEINFGTNASDYARDGECDDRRFVGEGMAASLEGESLGADAADCEALFNEGKIKLWDINAAREATMCNAIEFGNDTNDFAQDGECDDPRFEGFESALSLLADDAGTDATDCRKLCEFGRIFLRNY